MHHHIPVRNHPPSGGYVTLGTLILAAAAAVAIVALSGCHAAPPAPVAGNGFATSSADKAIEERLRQRDRTMKPLQPFDEGFVVVDDLDASD